MATGVDDQHELLLLVLDKNNHEQLMLVIYTMRCCTAVQCALDCKHSILTKVTQHGLKKAPMRT